MTETCSRCGKKFDTENCETYAAIRCKIHHVSKHSWRVGKYTLCGDCEYTLCGDCEHKFETFMIEVLEEYMENGQTSQS